VIRPVTGNDPAYFGARAVEEDIAAHNAHCVAARERHEEMADMYRFRVAMLKPGLPSWPREVAAEKAGQAAHVDLLDD
jgi:hypothetical protein